MAARLSRKRLPRYPLNFKVKAVKLTLIPGMEVQAVAEALDRSFRSTSVRLIAACLAATLGNCSPYWVFPKEGLKTYEGPVREAGETAALRFDQVSGLVPILITVDDRSEIWEHDRRRVKSPDGTFKIRSGDRRLGLPYAAEGMEVRLLPGVHEFTMKAGRPRGRSGRIELEKGVEGSARFHAEAGALYSVGIWRPRNQPMALFWIQDERSRRCVSDACPP